VCSSDLDYGQIEARVIAMASEDKAFCKALWENYDVHMYWSKFLLKLYPKTKDWIIKEHKVDGDDSAAILKILRSEIKNRWVFPQFYGASISNCARTLNLPEAHADKMGAAFWDMFSGVKKWQERVLEQYRRRGYVETLTGRRRWGPLDKGRILNTPIQGTASDIVVDAGNALTEAGYIVLMNIHDELTNEIPKEELEKQSWEICKIMCTPRFDFINVPIVVGAEYGTHWDEMKELKEYDSHRDFKFH